MILDESESGYAIPNPLLKCRCSKSLFFKDCVEKLNKNKKINIQKSFIQIVDPNPDYNFSSSRIRRLRIVIFKMLNTDCDFLNHNQYQG